MAKDAPSNAATRALRTARNVAASAFDDYFQRAAECREQAARYDEEAAKNVKRHAEICAAMAHLGVDDA